MRAFGIIFFSALLLTSFGSQAAETVKIGLAAPLTGDAAAIGEQALQGAKLAIENINKQGGVLGKQIILQAEDDVCDPKQAVQVANRLVSTGVKFVVGHSCSGAAIPASDIYEDAGVIMMSPTSANPKLTDAGKWNVFRFFGRTDTQAPAIADFITKTYANKKIAILYDTRDIGRIEASQTKDALASHNVKPILYEGYNAGEKDYNAVVSKLKNTQPDVIFLSSYLSEAALIIRQARQQGVKAQFVGVDTLASNDFWSITGDAGEGTAYVSFPEPRKLSENAATNTQFKQRHFEPNGYTYLAYSIVQSWAQAATQAKTFDAQAIAKVLKSMTFKTAAGPVGFDAKGDVSGLNWRVYKWHNGNFDYFVSDKK